MARGYGKSKAEPQAPAHVPQVVATAIPWDARDTELVLACVRLVMEDGMDWNDAYDTTFVGTNSRRSFREVCDKALTIAHQHEATLPLFEVKIFTSRDELEPHGYADVNSQLMTMHTLLATAPPAEWSRSIPDNEFEIYSHIQQHLGPKGYCFLLLQPTRDPSRPGYGRNVRPLWYEGVDEPRYSNHLEEFPEKTQRTVKLLITDERVPDMRIITPNSDVRVECDQQ